MMIKKIALACSTLILLLSCGKKDSNSTTQNQTICEKAPCFFAISTNEMGGSLGGISGADALCRTHDANARAFLVDGTLRAAAPNKIDWVLRANTTYFQLNGDPIGKTNSNALFDLPLTSNFISESSDYWTGLATNWETDDNCEGWTNNEPPVFLPSSGAYGFSDETGGGALKHWSENCSTQYIQLLCVTH